MWNNKIHYCIVKIFPLTLFWAAAISYIASYNIQSKSKGIRFGYVFWFWSLWIGLTLINDSVHNMRYTLRRELIKLWIWLNCSRIGSIWVSLITVTSCVVHNDEIFCQELKKWNYSRKDVYEGGSFFTVQPELNLNKSGCN